MHQKGGILMIKAFFPPLGLLAALLILVFQNGAFIRVETDRWQTQLQQAADLAKNENWSGAAATLTESHQDWSSRQFYLHIVMEHDAIDDADAMYQRAIAFAKERESSEFQAELSDLSDQLRLLAEMEQFSLKNIL